MIWLFLQVEGKCRQDFLGARGVMGVQGDVGPRGAPGPKGIRGHRGPKGFSYITEPVPLVGQKGIKGNPGIQFTSVKRVKFAKVKRNTSKLRLLLSLSKV